MIVRFIKLWDVASRWTIYKKKQILKKNCQNISTFCLFLGFTWFNIFDAIFFFFGKIAKLFFDFSKKNSVEIFNISSIATFQVLTTLSKFYDFGATDNLRIYKIDSRCTTKYLFQESYFSGRQICNTQSTQVKLVLNN